MKTTILSVVFGILAIPVMADPPHLALVGELTKKSDSIPAENEPKTLVADARQLYDQTDLLLGTSAQSQIESETVYGDLKEAQKVLLMQGSTIRDIVIDLGTMEKNLETRAVKYPHIASTLEMVKKHNHAVSALSTLFRHREVISQSAISKAGFTLHQAVKYAEIDKRRKEMGELFVAAETSLGKTEFLVGKIKKEIAGVLREFGDIDSALGEAEIAEKNK